VFIQPALAVCFSGGFMAISSSPGRGENIAVSMVTPFAHDRRWAIPP
jgi:hypothetical protein